MPKASISWWSQDIYLAELDKGSRELCSLYTAMAMAVIDTGLGIRCIAPV